MKVKKIFLCVITMALLVYLIPISTKANEQKKDYIILLDDSKSRDLELEEKNEAVKRKILGFKNYLNEIGITVLDNYDYESVPIIEILANSEELNKINNTSIKIIENESVPIESYEDSSSLFKCQSTTVPDTEYKKTVLGNALWNQGYRGSGVKVAVFDTGGSYHDDLKISGATTFVSNENWKDYEYHGTHVSGIIAGKKYGVAPEAQLYIIKTLSKGVSDHNQRVDVLTRSIDWAIKNKIKIVNMSYGYESDTSFLSSKQKEGLNEIFKKGYDNGLLFVAAAGNYGKTNNKNVRFPASSPHVIAVSNTVGGGGINDTSSIGPKIELSAPGTNLYSTVPYDKDTDSYFDCWDGTKNGYMDLSGTSMSAPVVSGIAALLYQKYPHANNVQIRDYLKFMAKKKTGLSNGVLVYGKNDEYGYGLVQGDIGNSIDKKITINNSAYLHTMPDINYKTPYNVSTQTVRAIRELNGWYEIETWQGHRWINGMGTFIGEFKVKLYQESTNLYNEKEGSLTGGSLSPQTVTATRRSGSWFEVKTTYGTRWIKPYYYSLSQN